MPRPSRSTLLDLLIVTALGAVVRLTALYSPHAVVFDERHTQNFVWEYLRHGAYDDVHPPFGIQLYTVMAHALGYSADVLRVTSPVGFRILPAIVGTLLVPLVYLLVRALEGPRRAALLAAIAVALDNALVLQSRVALTDILLITFAVGAVLAWLHSSDGARDRWSLLVVAGLLAGMSFAIKWTGLAALGLMLLFEGIAFLRAPGDRRHRLLRAIALAAPCIAVYYAVFWVHFSQVRTGTIGYFFSRVVAQQRLMQYLNWELGRTHHFYASQWFTWPLMIRPIHYWTQPRLGGAARDIYLVGNPAVWWGGLVLSLLVIVAALRRRLPVGAPRRAIAVLGAGWAINFLPFAAITRPMFLYHYLHAAVYVAALGAVSLGTVAPWNGEDAWRVSRRREDAIFWGAVLAIAALFLFFAPITYGWTLSRAALQLRLWLPGWG